MGTPQGLLESIPGCSFLPFSYFFSLLHTQVSLVVFAKAEDSEKCAINMSLNDWTFTW